MVALQSSGNAPSRCGARLTDKNHLDRPDRPRRSRLCLSLSSGFQPGSAGGRDDSDRALRVVNDSVADIGDASESRKGYEVTAPTRLLRAWQLLTAVNEELHADGTDDEAGRRAAKVFNLLRDDLVRSVSPPLAREVDLLLPRLAENADLAATRIACSGALGWVNSLMTSMLMQFAGQSDRVAHKNGTPAGKRAPRRTSLRRSGTCP